MALRVHCALNKPLTRNACPVMCPTLNFALYVSWRDEVSLFNITAFSFVLIPVSDHYCLTKTLHAISHIKWDVFAYEISSSHVKWTGSKFHMWRRSVRNMYFAYEKEHPVIKINFLYGIETIRYEILFSYMKLHVKVRWGFIRSIVRFTYLCPVI